MGSVRSSWRASSISPRPFFCWTRADASRVSAKPGGNCGGNTEVSRLSRDEPRVSVVVSAYNEERHVERLIHSLHVQTLPAYEVIVIDDGSSDDTAARAERAGATVLTVAHAGPAAGRNRGGTGVGDREDGCAGPLGTRCSVVAGTVVDDDHLVRRQGLDMEAVYETLDVPLLVVCAYDDAHTRLVTAQATHLGISPTVSSRLRAHPRCVGSCPAEKRTRRD